MKIISTSTANLSTMSTLEQLALYSGMDNLSVLEIAPLLSAELTPTNRATYEFEMDLQSALLEMSFNGIHIDPSERMRLVGVYEAEQGKIQTYLHQLCEAIGYYDYYLTLATVRYGEAIGVDAAELPTSWAGWLALPVSTRRTYKARNEKATEIYQKALKEFAEPFNANSPSQKLRLFYHFFGSPKNQICTDLYPDCPPPWSITRGITEYRTRNQDGDYTPSTDRDCLEKILKLAGDDDRDAAYWAQPFIQCCLSIADYTKALGFLRCKLENGLFRSSFGAVTETGRLNSKKNAQGYGSNAQNVDPRLRSVFTCPIGWKMATPDYEQIESRIVGAICYRLFGATRYINASESGDLHTLVCSMVWDKLPWPEEFNLDYLEKYGPPFPADMIRAAKKLAKGELYRGKSMRDGSKTLGHGCLTADHEVLTPNGWVPISTKPPVIMQYPGEFVEVSNWTHKEYTGQFVNWEGQSISIKMTGDHRVLYTTTDQKKLSTKAAIDVPKSAKIVLGYGYKGGSISEPLARLYAAYHCDGNWGGYNQVRFHFHKIRKIERLEMLAKEAGIEFKRYDDPTRFALQWKPEMHEPCWEMLQWDKTSLRAYMEELPNWDGYFGPTYISLLSKNHDWLTKWQTFNRLLGHGGNIQQPQQSGFGTQMYALQVNNRWFASRSCFDTDITTVETAEVYCPTVPSSYFFIKRKGRISVTGNSNYYGKPPTMSKHSHIPLPLVQHYQQVYFERFPELPQWHLWVIEQVQRYGEITTMLGRTRQFFGRPSDDATIREAIAYEPQSVAADYTNRALLQLHKQSLYHPDELPITLFLQKHDEIGFRYKESLEPSILPKVQQIMVQPLTLTAPDGSTRQWCVPVELQSGWNLGKYYNPEDEPDSTKRKRANLDGTREWKGPDNRTRTTNPFSIGGIIL